MLDFLPEIRRYTGVMPTSPLLMIFLVATAISSAACSVLQQNKPALRYYFDEDTGANITALTQPMVFYRESPWLAANSRDYVYLGPIEVSRNGRNSYLLWLGIWSTIDRPGRPSESVHDVFHTVYLITDEEPMKLEIKAWSGETLGLARTVYSTPVDSAENAFYGVTRDQIRRLTQAKSIMIHTNSDAPSGAAYRPWREENRFLADFASYLSDK